MTPKSKRDDPTDAHVNKENVVVLKIESGVKDGEKYGERGVDGPACKGGFDYSERRFH
jgi:hypothetical protein